MSDKNKGYLKPKKWLELPIKTGKWTLRPQDIIILGEIAYEVQKSSKELLAFDDVLTITSVDTKEFGTDMDHWEVSGK